jgi:DNA (cytosine-5)-methyltransferase 1
MGRKKSYITVTDQFCGAGGSSQGVRRLAQRNGGGIEVKLALNHWKLAIETHNTNFPDTFHDCTDISACDPRRYLSTDILITSPECTTHSPAGGNNHKALKKQMDMFSADKIDPATERSRATMWDVCRFAEYHNYNCIIVENVVEAKTRWALFDVWLMAMHKLGYNHKCVYLNSMHCHPTPQSRDRMYVVFWKQGNKAPKLDYMPFAHCPKCNKDVAAIQTWKSADKQFGKYRQQYVYCCSSCTSIVEPYYYAAFNCIDWSDIGIKIGERKKDLKPKTKQRAQFGIDKFSDPFIINDQHSTGLNFRVKSTKDFLPTIPTTHQLKLVTPPFIIKGEHNMVSPLVRKIDDPLQTQVSRQTMSLVVPPFMVIARGQSKAVPITDTLRTQSQMINHGIVSDSSWNSFITSYYNGSNCVQHITEVLGTQTTRERSALVTYQKPVLEECYFRMLKPYEVKIGMAFDPTYIVLGNSKDQVKQLGNAVTPPAMEWLVQQCIESLS